MHFDWVGAAAIYVTTDANGVWIKANRDGLRSLSNFLATLAEEDGRGPHFHLADYLGLETGSLELLVELVEDDRDFA